MNFNSEQLTVISYQLFEKQNEIAHFCTSREGGVSVGNYASLNLSPFSGYNPAHVAENQRILCNEFGIDSEKLIIPYQTHGTEIREIDDAFFNISIEDKNQYLNGVDALITNIAGVCIGVTTACGGAVVSMIRSRCSMTCKVCSSVVYRWKNSC